MTSTGAENTGGQPARHQEGGFGAGEPAPEEMAPEKMTPDEAAQEGKTPAGRSPSETVDAEMPESDEQVMDSLRSHVPITLLMDLANPEGPHSAEIAEKEGGDADWLDPGDGARE